MLNPSTMPPPQPFHLLSNTSNSHSPKRKRGLPAISTIPPTPPRSSPAPLNHDEEMRLSTSIPGVTIRHEEIGEEEGAEEQGTNSPRTKVAYNFQGLRLEDAGTVARFELDGPAPMKKSPIGAFGSDGAFDDEELPDTQMDGSRDREEDQQLARKRVKVGKQKKRVEIPETPQRLGDGLGIGRKRDEEVKFGIFIGEERTVDPAIEKAAKGVTLSNSVDEMVFTGSAKGSGSQGLNVSNGDGSLKGSYPSINRLGQSKSRKKRAGTPPLGGLSEVGTETQTSSLTWHDDEITGHNPTDPDDDGEGINGIGFRPTPAEAYARTQKRRQQMAEYRSREAREARKIRSERRKGSETSKETKEELETAKRVRFLDGEVKSLVATS